ncbi:MAG: YdiU family protein [Candidatus Cloacimonetes bacterium]|nr:YdiU family protein [Candidatus Cloacimonadota bacterium]
MTLNLKFNHNFINALQGDPIIENYTRQVPKACYSKVEPEKFDTANVIAISLDAAAEIDLDKNLFDTPEFNQFFTGQKIYDDMTPYAMCYGGHQFGNWANQLGDGRAIILGDITTKADKKICLQLKGAGSTPYSRSGDGYAVLRSSVREFLCSEAMHYLGVPTTRAISLALSGEEVYRDMMYDGNGAYEDGAIVCRTAPSFIRFGNFEILAARKELGLLKELVDFTITEHFSHLGTPSKDTYLKWYKEVCKTSADMVVHWLRVGFVHGVMNTDNMSIHGLTIDYGPYGWLEDYDLDWTPNTTDASYKRYAYGQQAHMVNWNLVQLANAIYPLIEDTDALQEALDFFADYYKSEWNKMMAKKLGWSEYKESDQALVASLIHLLTSVETDMTLFFRGLAKIDHTLKYDEIPQDLVDCYYDEDLSSDYIVKCCAWLNSYIERCAKDEVSTEARAKNMNSVNPKFVLRNYLSQLAIDKANENDYTMIHELLEVLKRPYDEQTGKEFFARKRPDWAKDKPGCSMLSCSS